MFSVQRKINENKKQKDCDADQLGGPERADHQTVGPKLFHKKALDGIEYAIEQKDLTVELAVSTNEKQHEKQ